MIKDIYLAGGCFWGTEKYFSSLPGVLKTAVGYANGHTINPTYQQVCHEQTGHAETVYIQYNSEKITLPFLLQHFYDIIDPTSLNRQGSDVGTQYRSGVFFTNPHDKDIIFASLETLQKQYSEPIAIQVEPLRAFFFAEEYHQHYLDKNPQGYCHIPQHKFLKASLAEDLTKKK